MTRYLLLLAVTAACSNLPDHPDTCGNGVIDRGESCDSSDDLCQHCQLTCPQHYDAQCMGAGDGYRCGADDICHAPSGVFQRDQRSEFDFAVGQGQSADLDGDRIGDIVGFSDVNIDARFGDPTLDFKTRSSVIVPFANSTIAVRPFPGYFSNPDDTSTYVAPYSDILLPTADGIAGFTSRDKSLVSYPFANSPGERGACAEDPDPVTHMPRVDPVATFGLDKHHVAIVRRHKIDGTLDLAVLDPTAITAALTDQCNFTVLCTLQTDSGDAGKFLVTADHYELPSSGNVRVSSIIAVAAAPTVSSKTANACVVQFTDDTGRATGSHFGFTAIAGPATIGGSTIALARTDPASPCPALYASVAPPAGGLQVFSPSPSAPCTLSSPVATVAWTSMGQAPIGHIALMPAIAGKAPDALAIATQAGFSGSTDVYAVTQPNPAVPMLLSHVTRPLLQMRSADLDGDGSTEGIGVDSLPLVGVSGQPDFDILYRTTGTAIGFVTYRIPTLTTPTYFDIGDFDGNGLPDIAFTEKTGPEEALMVSYSTPDRPLDPIEVATFNNVASLVRMDIADSNEPAGGGALDDLIVVNVEGPGIVNLAIMHGSPQRTMLGYYDPRPTQTGLTKLVASLAGNFDGMDDAIDVSMFEDTEPVTMYVARGIAHHEGLLDPPITLKTTAVTNVSHPLGAPSGILVLPGSKLTAWHVATHDVVVAIDPAIPVEIPSSMAGERKIAVLDPAMRDASGNIVTQFSGAMIDPNQIAFDMAAADVAGSGAKRLFITMGSFQSQAGDPMKDYVASCTMADSGVPTECHDLLDDLPEVKDGGWRCSAADAARVGAASRLDPVPKVASDDLLLLCKIGPLGRMYRVSRDDSGALRSDDVLDAGVVGKFQFVSIGDLNGDSVDDLVGISFDSQSQTPVLHIFQQCAADDLSCIDTALGKTIAGVAP